MTSPATLSPIPPHAPSLLEPLHARLGGPRAGGTLGSRVKAVRALELMASGPNLLNIRDTSEGKSGRAPRVVHAVRVPLSDIDQARARPRRRHQGVVMCASGMHSRAAAGHPRELRWDAASFSGGIGAWQRAGDEFRR